MNKTEMGQTRDGIRLPTYASFHRESRLDFASCRISPHQLVHSEPCLTDSFKKEHLSSTSLGTPRAKICPQLFSTQAAEKSVYWDRSSGLPRGGEHAVKGPRASKQVADTLGHAEDTPQAPKECLQVKLKIGKDKNKCTLVA